MNYIFGPVHSRRLGRSLGIDFYKKKTCNLNCIYCEIGVTEALVNQRDEYTPTKEILAAIDVFCRDREQVKKIDVVTVTGNGEPTLHTGMGTIISYLKHHIAKPVTVITNATMLMREDVQEELMDADILVPSLDAVLPRSFNRINRPYPGIDIEDIISGIRSFSKMYRGRIWLEVLLVEGINDSENDIGELIKAISTMKVDKIQLNTVFRPPLEKFAGPVKHKTLREIAARLEQRLSITTDAPAPVTEIEVPETQTDFSAPSQPTPDCAARIVEMIKRRPCTAADIDRIFQQGGPEKIEQLLEPFIQSGVVKKHFHENTIFYQCL